MKKIARTTIALVAIVALATSPSTNAQTDLLEDSDVIIGYDMKEMFLRKACKRKPNFVCMVTIETEQN
tara:strand:- start:1076 stop:1279 length:204 start_codon:yes stop_codon:yes gene_type:complete